MGNLYRSAVIVVALMGALLVAACQPGNNTTPATTTTAVTPPPSSIDGVVKGEASGDGRFTYEVTVRYYDGHMGGIKMS